MNPIQINLRDFFLKGQFDSVKIGQTKDYIINNFAQPDDDSDMGYNMRIFSYGCIEFHFEFDVLFLIWCDNLTYLKNTKSIKFDKWIIKDLAKMTLPNVLKILNSEKSNYSVKFDEKLKNAIIKIKPSNVNLWFEPMKEENDENPNNYKLIAFGLSDKDYDSFENNF